LEGYELENGIVDFWRVDFDGADCCGAGGECDGFHYQFSSVESLRFRDLTREILERFQRIQDPLGIKDEVLYGKSDIIPVVESLYSRAKVWQTCCRIYRGLILTQENITTSYDFGILRCRRVYSELTDE
jgi:hypothetical protein